MRTVSLAALLFLLAFPGAALAANTPCSGKKGGVARCVGDKFICNDGSISGSKRMCSAGGKVKASKGGDHFAASVGDDCACTSGRYCTGPRGGQYCYTKSGRKSYL